MKVVSIPVSFIQVAAGEIECLKRMIAVLESDAWVTAEDNRHGTEMEHRSSSEEIKTLFALWIVNHVCDPNLKTPHNLIDNRQFHVHVMHKGVEFHCTPLHASEKTIRIRLTPVKKLGLSWR